MNLVVRHAASADMEVLVALNLEVHDLHLAHRPDQFKARSAAQIAERFTERLQESSTRIWLAEIDGVPIGYVVAKVERREEDSWHPARQFVEIDEIGVHADHRRKGVARALLERVLEHARLEGATDLQLVSWAFNTSAHAAFESFGFVPKFIRFERAVR